MSSVLVLHFLLRAPLRLRHSLLLMLLPPYLLQLPPILLACKRLLHSFPLLLRILAHIPPDRLLHGFGLAYRLLRVLRGDVRGRRQ